MCVSKARPQHDMLFDVTPSHHVHTTLPTSVGDI